VALAEMARHITEDRSSVLAQLVKRRQVYRFDLAFHATLDLTHPEVLAALSITDAPQSGECKGVDKRYGALNLCSC
jgi:hypothetical protein